MNEEMVEQLMATAERLANAAESLDRVLGRLDAQQDALNTKVERIAAAVEDRVPHEMAARGEGPAAGTAHGVREVKRGLKGTGRETVAENSATSGVVYPGEKLRRVWERKSGQGRAR
jgi:hypothetical protein